MSQPARPEDVDEICGSLPETELGTSWGDVPTWKVPPGEKGKGFVMYRQPRQDAKHPVTGEVYDDLVVILTPGPGEKAALVEDPDSPFVTIDHFRNFNAVLVQESRLGEITRDELAEVITDAWLTRAPKKLVKEFLADG
ncbi:MmcQ/YjbR family DNA-binding protein [Nocardioides gilvus]|uniref:MmcQ/YjbR family DNA-binding protein n=1 Tax=Nocardioides gilvus TaxID=1735589 RepID=UPI000D741BD8|nr:MmcQ/YjbR family DNA-binding protein [Nocardioides gilvus]